MNNILTRYLQSRKLDIAKLEPDELKTFKEWDLILSEDPITTEKIKEFCEIQIGIIEAKQENLDNSYELTERLVLLHVVYTKLIRLITSPKKEREGLEKYIQSLIDSET